MDPITQHWLELQCQYTRHITAALVCLGTPGRDDYQPMARWPANEPISPLLQSSAEKLLRREQQKPYAKALPRDEGALVACPIVANGQCFGIVLVLLDSNQSILQKQTARSLQWGCEWFAWLARERKASRDQDTRLLSFVDVLALALKFEDFDQTAHVIVDALRERMNCARVCLGVPEGHRVAAIALSGSRPGESIRAVAGPIATAMEEAADQFSTIYVGPGAEDQGLVTHAHQQLCDNHRLDSLCSIPMIHNGEVVAVITYENFKAGALEPVQLQFCEQMALLLGPILSLKRKVAQGSKRRMADISGRVKAIAAAAIVTIIALGFIPGRYEISATASVESDKKQMLSAALDGFVATASARPGDRVVAGDVLATLDDRDLKLEQQKWMGKKAQFMKSYNNALGSMDRAEINIVKAQLDQANAQLALLENQLSRTEIRAPFDGVVVAGDLSQSLGAPVKRGDVLYEIAPADQYRVLLKVDERDVVDVKSGQEGTVRLSSLPDRDLNFTVNKITPVSVAAEGSHYFHVEAALSESDKSQLNPGMTGVAKVDAGRRAYLWMWFHRVFDWMRLWIWRL